MVRVYIDEVVPGDHVLVGCGIEYKLGRGYVFTFDIEVDEAIGNVDAGR